MANESLIKGAAFAHGGLKTGGFVNPQAAYVQGMNTPMSEIGRRALQEAAYKRKQDEVELKNYVNKLEDIELGKVEDSMRPEVTQFLVDNKNDYAEAARLAADLDADDPRYMEAVSEMNKINSKFKALSKNLDLFKEKRAQFYDDVKNNTISKGANIDALTSLFKNNEYDIEIDEYGNLSIDNEGDLVPLTDFDEDTDYNYFLTNNEGFNTLMTLNEKANTGATKISGGLEQNYRYQLNGLFNTMGREDLMSMVYDTVISNVPLKDREDFDAGLLDIEREGELRTWLSNTYLDTFKTVAAQAAKQKEIKNRPKPTRSEIVNNRKIKKVTDYFNKMKGQGGTFIPGRRSTISLLTLQDADGEIQYIPVDSGAKQTDIFLRNDEEALAWLNQ